MVLLKCSSCSQYIARQKVLDKVAPLSKTVNENPVCKEFSFIL